MSTVETPDAVVELLDRFVTNFRIDPEPDEREHLLRGHDDGFQIASRRVVLDQASMGTKNLAVFL